MENTTSTNIETVALVVDKPGGAFELKPVVFDEVRDDEYLVEMLYSGICHTVHLTSLPQVAKRISTKHRPRTCYSETGSSEMPADTQQFSAMKEQA